MPLREEAKWRRGRKESLRQVNVGHPVIEFYFATLVILIIICKGDASTDKNHKGESQGSKRE